MLDFDNPFTYTFYAPHIASHIEDGLREAFGEKAPVGVSVDTALEPIIMPQIVVTTAAKGQEALGIIAGALRLREGFSAANADALEAEGSPVDDDMVRQIDEVVLTIPMVFQRH